MNPMHSQKVSIVHFFCNPKIDTIPCPSESVWFLHFFATQKLTETHPSENAWILQFFCQPIRSQQGWSFRCSLQAKRIQVVLRRL